MDTVFALDGRIKFESLKYKGKIGTLLSAVLQMLDADLVVADIIPLACLLFLRHRRKVVYFAQDYDESYYKSSFQKYLVRFLYLFGLNFCHIPTIAVSHPLASLLRSRFNASVSIAENGVDTEVFYHSPVKEMVASKADRKVILVLSRRDPRKGFDIAVRVIRSLPKCTRENIEVWTVGETMPGSFSDVVRQRDFGYVGEEQLRNIMSSSDIFLYPTRHEGFPLMVVEAFACRCPVVTTTAVPYAQDGGNALVSPIEDVTDLAMKLERLLNDAGLANALRAAGSDFAVKHSLNTSCDVFASCIAHLTPSFNNH
jgi:glycosyltransferase involved in cell wall biosynthesis